MQWIRNGAVLSAALLVVTAAAPGSEIPCPLNGASTSFPVYDCTATSHHNTPIAETVAKRDIYATRVTGRLAGGPVVYDVSRNTFDPPAAGTLDDLVRGAGEALKAAAGHALPLSEPHLLSSSVRSVTDERVEGLAGTPYVYTFFNFSDWCLAAGGVRSPPNGFRVTTLSCPAFCIGDLGDQPYALGAPPKPPCPVGASLLPAVDTARLGIRLWYTHTDTSIYAAAFVTGRIVSAHYEVVGGGETTLTIPIVLSPSGGSAFTSELTLANFAATDTQATFAYTPAFGGAAGTVTDTLPGATQRIVPDAVAYLKSLGLTDPGAGGVLRMTFEGATTPDVYASVRTTAAVPEGRVSLAYPALPPSRLFSSSVVLCGLRQNSLDRSNVAVLNAGSPSDGDVTLRMTVTSGDPANSQSKTLPDVTLSPGGFAQVSSILISNGLALSNGYVRVERILGTAPFFAYAVVNDQATSDGSFIEPIAASAPAPISSVMLPVVVETAAYSTELVLTNLSSTTRTLNFTWVAPALTNGKATFSIALLPGEQQILPGFVQLLRDRGAVTDARGPSFAGALFVSDSTGDLRGVAISARILSTLDGGRVGVALPSFPSGSESTSPVWLCGLQQNGTTRSNLALVNPGSVDSSQSSFRIDLYDGANGVKTTSLDATVPARGFVQIDRILAAYAPGVTQGCALVTRTSGANPFLAYAVLNDGGQPGQRSGDGAYVASVPLIP